MSELRGPGTQRSSFWGAGIRGPMLIRVSTSLRKGCGLVCGVAEDRERGGRRWSEFVGPQNTSAQVSTPDTGS